MRALKIFFLSLTLGCCVENLAYAQCAGCGADYNKTDREKADSFSQGYEMGKKQGYDDGHREGVNQEKLINGLDKLMNNMGDIGSSAVKGDGDK